MGYRGHLVLRKDESPHNSKLSDFQPFSTSDPLDVSNVFSKNKGLPKAVRALKGIWRRVFGHAELFTTRTLKNQGPLFVS